MSARQSNNSTPRPSDLNVTANEFEQESSPEAMIDMVQRLMAAMSNALQFSGAEVQRAVKSSAVQEQLAKIQQLDDDVSYQQGQRDEELQKLRIQLEDQLKDEHMAVLKKKAEAIIDEAVKKLVAQKVEEHFSALLPTIVKKQAVEHTNLMNHIDTELLNCEARRQNASSHLSTGSPWTATWKPLLRPLPSAAQSPAYVISSRKPWSMYTVPPTPITAGAGISRTNSFQCAPAPLQLSDSSPLFPTSLEQLQKHDADGMRQLLNDYELPPAKYADESRNYSEDMNTFMAHIGTPYFFASPPSEVTSKSTNSKLAALPPLITTTHF